MAVEVEQIRFPEGDRVFTEGDTADALFLVVKGKIGLYRTVDGRKMQLRTMTGGEVFGVTSIVNGSPRTATAVTLAPSQMVRIPAALLHQKLERTDPLIRQVMTTMAEQVRDTRRAIQMRPRSVSDYVRLLQEQADNLGKFLINTHEVEESVVFASQIKQLQTVIDQLRVTAETVRDRREDSYVDAERLV